VWRGGGHGEAELLAGAYRASLQLAQQLGARSLALPAISMGIYGYPAEDAARIAVQAVSEGLATPSALELVRFVLRPATWVAFAAAVRRHGGAAE
jgi:O-acetyl-ADP-ribose deacetylase (regulator of RNase III)